MNVWGALTGYDEVRTAGSPDGKSSVRSTLGW